MYTSSNEPMENCVAPGLDEFDVLLEVVLSLVRVLSTQKIHHFNQWNTSFLLIRYNGFANAYFGMIL